MQTGPSSGASAYKSYVVDVPVYAQTIEDQDDWNKLTHSFSILEKDEVREYEVLQNIANTMDGSYQVYPWTGVKDADGNTYFKANTWAFAISPRNLKQYNYQMLMDSLVWGNYSVESLEINFIPSGGATQAGSFEAIFVANGQLPPSPPYTNSTNSVAFNLTQGGSFRFDCGPGNAVSPVKTLRGVDKEFSTSSDFGILWTRVDGVPNVAAGHHLPVAKLQIKVGVYLSNYSPNPYAQLIGPWIEAGFPITGDGDDKPFVQTKAASTTGSQMLSVESITPTVELRMVERGRAKMPRWYIIPTVEDKTVTNLRAHGNLNATGHKLTHRAYNENAGKMLFPRFISTQFDGAVTGKTLLDALNETGGDDPASGYAAGKPFYPVVDSEALYDQSVTITNFPASPDATETRLQLVFFESQQSDNSTNLAQGGVKINYTPAAEKLGLRAGATLRFITSFQPGSITVDDKSNRSFAAYQISAGWEEGSTEQVGTGNDLGFSWGGLLKTGASFIAGGISSLVGGPEGRNSIKSLVAANTHSSNTDPSTGTFVKVTKDGSNEVIEVQSQAFTVPDDATYRSEVGELIELGRKEIAKAYLSAFPAAAKYGVNAFDPAGLTNDMSRITITGQINSLHQAYVALVGGPSNLAAPTFDVTAKELIVLAASRVNPNDDPELFFETAIAVTPLYDGMSSTGTSGVMLKNAVPATATDKGFFAVTESRQVGSKIKETNTTLDALQQVIFASSNVCNFSIAWPSHLVDPVSKTLTRLEAGEKVYFSLFKSSAITYAHTEAEPVGTFNFIVFPNMALGRDKASAGNAACQYTLEMGEGMKFTGVTKGAELAGSAYMCIDSERRFALQSTVPNDGIEVQSKAPKVVKLNKTKL